MIRKISYALCALAGLVGTSALIAKQYVDYSPEKGLWEVNAIEVDPNHVDDYLTGLRQSEVPAFEVMKKHGIIDQYRLFVRQGYNKGSPSVLVMTHFTSAAMLEPDKARDQMIEKEIFATFSEAKGKIAVAGFEKYRQFIDDSLWSEQKFPVE